MGNEFSIEKIGNSMRTNLEDIKKRMELASQGNGGWTPEMQNKMWSYMGATGYNTGTAASGMNVQK